MSTGRKRSRGRPLAPRALARRPRGRGWRARLGAKPLRTLVALAGPAVRSPQRDAAQGMGRRLSVSGCWRLVPALSVADRAPQPTRGGDGARSSGRCLLRAGHAARLGGQRCRERPPPQSPRPTLPPPWAHKPWPGRAPSEGPPSTPALMSKGDKGPGASTEATPRSACPAETPARPLSPPGPLPPPLPGAPEVRLQEGRGRGPSSGAACLPGTW